MAKYIPKDGQELKIECELVLVFSEGDSSVGINSGWTLVGLQVGRKFLEIENYQFDKSSENALRSFENGIDIEENY